VNLDQPLCCALRHGKRTAATVASPSSQTSPMEGMEGLWGDFRDFMGIQWVEPESVTGAGWHGARQ
jgi:hypothetical protein